MQTLMLHAYAGAASWGAAERSLLPTERPARTPRGKPLGGEGTAGGMPATAAGTGRTRDEADAAGPARAA